MRTHRIPADPRRIDPFDQPLDEYVVVDVETTGFDPESDRLIEVGAVHVKDGRTVGTFARLLDPHMPIPSHITRLTGIDNHMTAGQGEDVDMILHLDEWVGDLPILAHNAPFDMGFLDMAWWQATGRPVFDHWWLDTLEMARRLHPELAHHRVADLIGFYGVGDVEEHRGLSDAVQEAELYRLMCRELSAGGGRTS